MIPAMESLDSGLRKDITFGKKQESSKQER